MTRDLRVAALSGGVGGARLLHGLERCLPPGRLTAIVNVGDDLEHWGLSICPDLDTVMYTLADLAPVARGWGIEGETFHALEAMRRLGAPDWFALGDRDLATHLRRSEALRRGEPLSAVTAGLCRALDVRSNVLPATDDPLRTHVETRDGRTLPFQEWLVREQAPRVARIRLEGPRRPAPRVLEALERADVVVFGPSNPYVSIDPILAVDGVRDACRQKPVVMVSPIVGGQAVKGPLADMLQDLAGRAPAPAAVRDHYGALVSHVVVERGEAAGLDGVRVLEAETLMTTRERSRALAEALLDHALGNVR